LALFQSFANQGNNGFVNSAPPGPTGYHHNYCLSLRERRSPAWRVRREGDIRLSPGVTQGQGRGKLFLSFYLEFSINYKRS